MLTILKLLQAIFSTLHSEGTPGQVAAGMMLGAGIGLTPLGFLLDPLFDRIGLALLAIPALRGLWTDLYNAPLFPYTNFNNSVTLGSFVVWFVLTVPLYFGMKRAIAYYREYFAKRVNISRFMKALKASSLYNYYSWFVPQ